MWLASLFFLAQVSAQSVDINQFLSALRRVDLIQELQHLIGISGELLSCELNSSAIATNQASGCYPTYQWICTKPTCLAQVTSVCNRPSDCTTNCAPGVIPAGCNVRCSSSSCYNECPRYNRVNLDGSTPANCPGLGCPKCNSTCDLPVCSLIDKFQSLPQCSGQIPIGACTTNCSAPVCSWVVEPPKCCPKPKCKLVLQQPAACNITAAAARQVGLYPTGLNYEILIAVALAFTILSIYFIEQLF